MIVWSCYSTVLLFCDSAGLLVASFHSEYMNKDVETRELPNNVDDEHARHAERISRKYRGNKRKIDEKLLITKCEREQIVNSSNTSTDVLTILVSSMQNHLINKRHTCLRSLVATAIDLF